MGTKLKYSCYEKLQLQLEQWLWEVRVLRISIATVQIKAQTRRFSFPCQSRQQMVRGQIVDLQWTEKATYVGYLQLKEPNNYQGFTCRNQQAGSNVVENQSIREGPEEDRSIGQYLFCFVCRFSNSNTLNIDYKDYFLEQNGNNSYDQNNSWKMIHTQVLDVSVSVSFQNRSQGRVQGGPTLLIGDTHNYLLIPPLLAFKQLSVACGQRSYRAAGVPNFLSQGHR